MNDSPIVHVEDCTSAKTAWLKLQNLYQEPSTANKMRLYEEFLSSKIDNSTSVRSHVEHLSSVRSQLRSVGVNIEDSLYKLAMLRSLSRKYDDLVVTLENQIDDINVEDLHSRIYREESRQTNTDVTSGLALSANNFSRPPDRKKNFRCHFCNKDGHFKSQCWKIKQNGKHNNSNMMKSSEQPHEFMAMEAVENLNISWFVDSGASYHICCEKDVFTENMRKLNFPKTIRLGDGKEITAKYEGDILLTFKSTFGEYKTKLQNVICLPCWTLGLIPFCRKSDMLMRINLYFSANAPYCTQ